MLIVHSSYSTSKRVKSDKVNLLVGFNTVRTAKTSDVYTVRKGQQKSKVTYSVRSSDLSNLDRLTPKPLDTTEVTDAEKGFALGENVESFVQKMRAQLAPHEDVIKVINMVVLSAIERLPRFRETFEHVSVFSKKSEATMVTSSSSKDGSKAKPKSDFDLTVDNIGKDGYKYGNVLAASVIRWLILNRKSHYHYNDVVLAAALVAENADFKFKGDDRLVLADGFHPDIDGDIISDVAIGMGAYHTAITKDLSRYLGYTDSEFKMLRYSMGLLPWWVQTLILSLNTLRKATAKKWYVPTYTDSDPTMENVYYPYFITARQPGLSRVRMSKMQSSYHLTESDVVTEWFASEGANAIAFSLVLWKGVPNDFDLSYLFNPKSFSEIDWANAVDGKPSDTEMAHSKDQWVNAITGISDRGVFIDPNVRSGYRLISDLEVNTAFDTDRLLQVAYFKEDHRDVAKVLVDRMDEALPLELSVTRRIVYE